MSRGFGATLGAGSTDIITSTLAAKSTLRSYHVKAYRLGDGGGGFGRIWEDSAIVDQFIFNSATYQFTREFSTADGQWSRTSPATSTWVDIVLTYDGSSVANDPVYYENGSALAMSEDNTPEGSITNTSGAYSLGNRASDSARNWDGMLAEFAVWDVILDAAEAAALGKGVSPLLIRPASLVEYIPMIRDNVSFRRSAPTVTATGIQPHPSVIYPGGLRTFNGVVGAGDGEEALGGSAMTGAQGTPPVVFSIGL
jgi:hypothetical protein